MGFILAAILKILLLIFSALLHLACAAAIVILFVLRLNTQDEEKKSLYLKLMILAAVLPEAPRACRFPLLRRHS